MSQQINSDDSPGFETLLPAERHIAASLSQKWINLPADRRQACIDHYPAALIKLAGVNIDDPFEPRPPITMREAEPMFDAGICKQWPHMTRSQRRHYTEYSPDRVERLGLEIDAPYVKPPPDPDWL